MPRLWPSDRFWLLLALGLRLAFALKLGDRYHQIDELGYSVPAMRLAATGSLGGGEGAFVPAVPALFFALFFLLGPHLLYPRLAQAFVGTLLVWLVGRMTRDLAKSESAGRLALALSAVYPFFVYYSGMVMSETLYLVLAAAGLWQLSLSLRDGGAAPRRAAAAGLSLGLAALARAEGAPIALLVWLACAAACALGRWRWRALALALLCWASPLLLRCWHNQASGGAFKLDNHGGMTLLHGTVLFELNEVDTALGMKALEDMPFYRDSLALPAHERDRVYFREGLRFMLEDPGRALAQWARKFQNFWRFYPRTDKAYHETQHSHPGVGLGRRVLVAISLLWEPWLILGGLWGLWRLREKARELFPLGLFLLGTLGVHLISVSQMRYRLPVMPLLILGVSSLAAEKWQKGRQSAKR